MANNQRPKVCFRVNEHGWILLFEKLGKTILRAHKYKERGRTVDPHTQHRAFEFEFESGIKIKSKLYDTAQFYE